MRLSARNAALLVALGAFATVGGAWLFQAAGYAPCELCLKERLPYYVGVLLALLVAAAAWRGPPALARAGLWALAALFLGSAVVGAYHAGVEWKFWAGPTDCTGDLTPAGSVGDFMKELNRTEIVRCDAVAIRILGLSLAGWNAVISLGLAAVAALGAAARRA